MDPQNLTPPGDQYSLGCVLYFLLTGRYPFPEGSAAEKMMAHQFQQPTPLNELNPEVTAELNAIVERLMQKAPESRYGTTSELVEALRPLATIAEPARRPQPAPAARGAVPATSGRSVSVSAPTPKPQALGTLPTRSSLRGAQAAAPPPAPEAKPEAKVEPPQPDAERVIPGAQEEEPSGGGWDERLGPIGIAISALVACGLVYALAVWLQLVL
jgi:serine/threonine protein kinase